MFILIMLFNFIKLVFMMLFIEIFDIYTSFLYNFIVILIFKIIGFYNFILISSRLTHFIRIFFNFIEIDQYTGLIIHSFHIISLT